MWGRPPAPSEANLTLETVTFEQQIKVHLPVPNKGKVESLKWDPPEMPGVPTLTNSKALKKHTKLLVFNSDTKSKAMS